jgi:hypothetical protein
LVFNNEILVFFRGDTSEQIFLTIDRAAQEAGLYTQERSLIMPLFSVSSELQVEDYLKKVRILLIIFHFLKVSRPELNNSFLHCITKNRKKFNSLNGSLSVYKMLLRCQTVFFLSFQL